MPVKIQKSELVEIEKSELERLRAIEKAARALPEIARMFDKEAEKRKRKGN